MITKFFSPVSPFSCFAIVTGVVGEIIIWYSMTLLLVAAGALVLELLRRKIPHRAFFTDAGGRFLWGRLALANLIVGSVGLGIGLIVRVMVSGSF